MLNRKRNERNHNAARCHCTARQHSAQALAHAPPGIAEIRRLPSGKAPLVPLQRAEARDQTESSTTSTTQPGENGTTTTTPSERTSTTLRGHTSTTQGSTASSTPPTTSP